MSEITEIAPAGDATLDLVCTLTGAEMADRRAGIAHLVRDAEEMIELADGYSLRFPGSTDSVNRLVTMIVAERECCLFFAFALTFTPNRGPVWLHVRGPAGVKELVTELVA